MRAALTALCAVLTACSTPPYTPEVAVPQALAASTTQTSTTPTPAAWPSRDWYSSFGSAELTTLIDAAQHNNLDLAAAVARVKQADAHARAAGAAFLPQVDVGANATHITGRSDGQTLHETDWAALLSASYEVDFWGKNRAAHHAARWLVTASQADHDALALTTSSAVASVYFQVLSLRERLQLANSALASAQQVLKVIQARFAVGMANSAALATQKAVVANAQLAIAPLQQQEFEALGALALLVGRNVDELQVAGQSLDGLNEPMLAPGLPSELLLRRPDVLQAEANLQAAHADVLAARAALYPSLTLNLSGGLQNPGVQAALVTLGGTGYSVSVGASLLQTVFDGGRRRAVRDETQARQEELLANYRHAILAALIDVQTALSARQHLDAQHEPQTESLNEAEQAFAAAQAQYRAGASDYLALLDAQQRVYAAREQAAQYQLARLQAAISLSKALGGGWQQAPDHTAQNSPH